jgi:hypothetical protein
VVENTPATPATPDSGHAARADGSADGAAAQPRPGFAARGRLRRRARFLRKARELAYRDLGGLVFSLHRFEQRNDPLVLAKLSTLGQIDTELRALEAALQEPQPITVLREAGITACARCAAIHSSEDRFCPNCGLPLSRRVDLPVAGPAAAVGASQPQRPAVPVVTAVRAWTSAAASPGASPPQSPPVAQPGPATGRDAQPPTPAPVQPQQAPSPPPAVSESTEVRGRPAVRPDTPRPAGASDSKAPVDGQPAREPQPASGQDDDQPTEIMRPSSPAGS